MEYESPTIELLADSEMANVQGEGIFVVAPAVAISIAGIAAVVVVIGLNAIVALYGERRRRYFFYR